MVLIQDEIQLKKPGEIWWFMHTKANIQLEDEGKTAILELPKIKNKVKIKIIDSDYKFEVLDAKPLSTSPNPKEQNENKEYKKLAIHIINKADCNINVLFVPQNSDDKNEAAQKITPLSQWK